MGTKIELQKKEKKSLRLSLFARNLFTWLPESIQIPQRTVFDWLSLYRSGGWDALKEGFRSGRPWKVSAVYMKWVYNVVALGNPRHFQFEFCL